jgi:hypothetical protein
MLSYILYKAQQQKIDQAKGKEKAQENSQDQPTSQPGPKEVINRKCKFGGCCNPLCLSGTRRCWQESPNDCPFFRHYKKLREEERKGQKDIGEEKYPRIVESPAEE